MSSSRRSRPSIPRNVAVVMILAVMSVLAGCATGSGRRSAATPAVGSSGVSSPSTTEATTGAETSTTLVAPSTSVASVPPGSSVGSAVTVLGRLRLAETDPTLPQYRRKAFGPGWEFDRATGCNTRDRVLLDEATGPVVRGARCKILSGRWTSPYDGATVTDPARLQIDHRVPLAVAWRSGAAAWTPERRSQYANDLTDPNTLVAVSSKLNEEKGDDRPDQWMPPAAADRCEYAADWVEVKARWDMTVTDTERNALASVLARC